MKTYQFTTCRRENGEIVVLDLKTPPTLANSPSEALELLKSWFTQNNCLPFREVS